MAPDAEYEKLLTPAECAALWKVDPKTITRWAKTGMLPSIRTLGGHRRYREAEVMALLNRPADAVPDPLKAPVRTLWPSAVSGAPAAVRNRLQSIGLATVGDLIACDLDDLEDLGLRPAQVNEVRLVLARKGMTLRGEILGHVAA